MKQVAPPPCPEWYGDREWNIAIWGAYAFCDSQDHSDQITQNDNLLVLGDGFALERGIIGDQAWGGGIDLKYFFHRYFGVGLEGYILQTDPENLTLEEAKFGFSDPNDTVGAIKGTFTFRYPIACSRFAPYVYAGGGVLFGVERQRLIFETKAPPVRRDEDDPEGVGEVGAGIEVRFTRHIGWINDIGWNFTENDNFGMFRSGINFAF
jgi:opacity protein-like surface antigen